MLECVPASVPAEVNRYSLADPPRPIPYINRFIAVVSADAPICKNFHAVNLDDKEGAWENPQAALEWAQLSSQSFGCGGAGNGTWQKGRPSTPRDVTYREHDICDLPALAQLWRGLGPDPCRAIIMGRAKELFRTQPETALRRLQANFEDVPSVWLMVDVDGVDIAQVGKHFSVAELQGDEAELEAFCDRFIARALPPWLDDADYVAALTSSTGFASADRLSFRLIFRLAAPLNGDQRNAVARHLDQVALSRRFEPPAGKRALIDDVVATRARIIFTSYPRVSAKIRENGVIRRATGAASRSVIFVQRESETVAVPAEALTSASLRQGNRQPTATIANRVRGQSILSIVADGNTNDVVTRFIAAYCHNTAEKFWNAGEVKAAIAAAFAMRSIDLDKEDRGRFVDLDWIERDFERLRQLPKLLRANIIPDVMYPVQQTVGAVRSKIAKTVEDEIDEALKSEIPRVILIKAAPGAGKNHALYRAMPRKLLEQRRIFYYGPTVALGEENVQRHRDVLAGPDVEQFEVSRLVRQRVGRTRLCTDQESGIVAERIERARLSSLELVCPHCPRFASCAYPAQWRDTGTGLIAHQHQHAVTSARKIDPESESAPNLVVVDEGFLQTVLAGGAGATSRPVSELRPDGEYGGVIRRRRVKNDAAPLPGIRLWATADFKASREELIKLLGRGDGPPHRTEMAWFAYREAGARRSKIAMQSESDHQRWLQSELRNKMTERRSATKNCRREIDRQIDAIGDAYVISRFAYSLFFAIDTNLEISAREEALGVFRFVDKNGQRAVRCMLRVPLPRIMLEKCSLWLDGTADPNLLKLLFGGSRIETRVHDWPIKPGAYDLTQYIDRPGSKKMMLEAKGAYGNSNIRKLHSFILSLSQKYRRLSRSHRCVIDGTKKDVLVICQLPVRKKLEEFGLPDNVALEHFNNIRGIDVYRDIPCGVFVGRPEPKDTVSEAMTEALFFDNPSVIGITRMSAWRAKHGRERFRRERRVRMADGTTMSFPCEGHPDEHVEAVRQQIVNAEVLQAVLRMRPYDRTEANAAEIHLFGDVDVGLPVHRLKRWVDAEVSAVEAMVAEGVVFASATSASAAYPKIFEGKAVRTAEAVLKRELAVFRSYIGILRNWVEVEFRLAVSTSDGRAAYKQRAFVSPTETDLGKLIAQRLNQPIRWRRGSDEWRDAEPPQPRSRQ